MSKSKLTIEEQRLRLQAQQTAASRSTSRNVSCLTFLILALVFGPFACGVIVVATGILATGVQ